MHDNVYTFMHETMFPGKTRRKLFSHTQTRPCVRPAMPADTLPLRIHHVGMCSYASAAT